MRLIKLVLISAVVFFLLLTAMSLLIPSNIRISRAIDIRSATNDVLPYLKDQSKWPLWNAYFKDSSKKFTVSTISNTDSLVLTRWKAGDKTFQSGMAVYNQVEGTVTVQWYFDFTLSWYPWEKIASIIYDGQLGTPMQESLTDLKTLVEANP